MISQSFFSDGICAAMTLWQLSQFYLNAGMWKSKEGIWVVWFERKSGK